MFLYVLGRPNRNDRLRSGNQNSRPNRADQENRSQRSPRPGNNNSFAPRPFGGEGKSDESGELKEGGGRDFRYVI